MSDVVKLNDLKKYFGTEEHPVSMDEMREFWESLSDAEKQSIKDQYKSLAS
jgi:hypothetical protein